MEQSHAKDGSAYEFVLLKKKATQKHVHTFSEILVPCDILHFDHHLEKIPS